MATRFKDVFKGEILCVMTEGDKYVYDETEEIAVRISEGNKVTIVVKDDCRWICCSPQDKNVWHVCSALPAPSPIVVMQKVLEVLRKYGIKMETEYVNFYEYFLMKESSFNDKIEILAISGELHRWIWCQV